MYLLSQKLNQFTTTQGLTVDLISLNNKNFNSPSVVNKG